MTRVYVASLSGYNAGHLLGRWIELDANTERSDIATEIAEMLRESKYPNVTVECPGCDGTLYTKEGNSEYTCEI